MSDKTAWFADCGWGVFCHWLGAAPSSDGGSELTAEVWNRQVDAFDVEGLANQLAAIGAPYFFITIGQNSGHYIAPNHVYDKYVAIRPSKCARRDLVADLYNALHPRGIALLVYLPSGAPAADPVAVSSLGWEWGFEGGWPHSWGTRRTGKRLAEFQKKWEGVIREWSIRWGPKVRGWWIDGCYFADEMYRHDDAPNFRSFAAALKAGNPDALVAFNPGVLTPVVCHTEHEDYTAGEIASALPECPGPWVERNGHKARYHVLSYLGESWCKGRPRFPDELVIGYTKHVTSKGGVITWDVPIERSGLIPTAFVEQLSAISRAIQKKEEPKRPSWGKRVWKWVKSATPGDAIQTAIFVVILSSLCLLQDQIEEQKDFSQDSLRPWLYADLKGYQIEGTILHIAYDLENPGQSPALDVHPRSALSLSDKYPVEGLRLKANQDSVAFGSVFPSQDNVSATAKRDGAQLGFSSKESIVEHLQKKGLYFHIYVGYSFPQKQYKGYFQGSWMLTLDRDMKIKTITIRSSIDAIAEEAEQ